MPWACPEPCTTEESETCLGEAIDQGRLTPTGDGPLVIYGDGSGGERSGDDRYMRCGWAWVRLRLGGDGECHLAAGKRDPLPGPRQSNNRAELWAFCNCVKSTNDYLHFWTDSAVLVAGWRTFDTRGPSTKRSTTGVARSACSRSRAT
eukprot:7481634-Pyramimonas_sp.AAC.1